MLLGAYVAPKQLDEFLRTVTLAEECGFDRVWVPDSQMIWRNPYLYIDRGLSATERVVFGTGVTNPVTRHFATTASVNATLAELHPGRVILGIGRGDSSVRTLGLKPMPTAPFEQLVRRIRALIRGETVDLDGNEIRITFASGPNVPLMMSAIGPRNLRLAGALADIVQPQVGVHPETIEWATGHIRAGAAEAGRDPDEVEVSIFAATCISDDLQAAYQHCRWAPTTAAPSVQAVIRANPDHDMPEPLVRSIESLGPGEARQANDYYKAHAETDEEAAAYVSDELVDSFALVGPPERCLAGIEAIRALGVDEVALGMMNGEYEQLERVGEAMRPALGAEATR